MINLITGGPGSGKTCFLIGELLTYQKEKRRIFVHGVPGLTIPHERIYCESKTCTVCEDKPVSGARLAIDWPDYVTANDVVILDEVQHIWRPRSSQSRNAEVPRSLAGLETARHLGADFWLVTQSPSLVDIHARRMVTRHIHIKYSALYGRLKFEWAECQTDVSMTWTGDCVKGPYKLDKSHFDLYKSADMHTVQDRKKPLTLYAYAICFALVPLVSWWAYASFQTIGESDDEIPIADRLETVPAGSAISSIGREYSNSRFFDSGEDIDIFDRSPEDPNRPESAPAYRHLVEIKDFPRLSACIYTESTNLCQCYSQQATRIRTDYQYCRSFVANPPFNPYLEPTNSFSSLPRLSNRSPINSSL